MKKLFILLLFIYSQAQGVDHYWVGGTASWDGTAGTKWAATSGGLGVLAVPTAADNVYLDAGSGAVTVTINAAARTCDSLIMTGFTGTLAGAQTLTISGNVKLGGTITYTGAITFTPAAGTFKIFSNGKSFQSALTFNDAGAGSTWMLQDSLTTTGAITLTAGTLNVLASAPNAGTRQWRTTCSTFNSSNANVRTLGGTLWSGSTLTLTGTGTILTIATVTNLTSTDGPYIESTSSSSSARTLTWNAAYTTYGLAIKAGSGTVTTTSFLLYSDLDFTGFTGTWANSAITVAGDVTLGSGMTVATGTAICTITGIADGTSSFTSNGVTCSRSITVDDLAAGGSMVLADDFSGLRAIIVTQGGFNANNKNITAGSFNFAGTGTKTITMGSGTWTVGNGLQSGTVWSANTTGTTFSPGTSLLKVLSGNHGGTINSVTGGGLTYNNIWFAFGGTQDTLQMTGTNTFNDFKIDAGMCFRFTANTTTTVTSFSVRGTQALPIIITSITTGLHTITKSGGGQICCDWLNLQHSKGLPATLTWYAGANSVNNQATVTAGSGWIFSQCPAGNFFKMF